LKRWAHPITAKKAYQDFRSCNFSRLSDSIKPEKKLIELRDDDTINNNKNKNYWRFQILQLTSKQTGKKKKKNTNLKKEYSEWWWWL
jgi:hypothetical protein